jgi:hypothetical protein
MRILYHGTYDATGITTDPVVVSASAALATWAVHASGPGTVAVDLELAGTWVEVHSAATPAPGAGAVPLGWAEVVELTGRLRARWTPDSGTGTVTIGLGTAGSA